MHISSVWQDQHLYGSITEWPAWINQHLFGTITTWMDHVYWRAACFWIKPSFGCVFWRQYRVRTRCRCRWHMGWTSINTKTTNQRHLTYTSAGRPVKHSSASDAENVEVGIEGNALDVQDWLEGHVWMCVGILVLGNAPIVRVVRKQVRLKNGMSCPAIRTDRMIPGGWYCLVTICTHIHII